MAKYQQFLARVPGTRTQAALRGIFSMFLTDDDPPTLKLPGDGSTGFSIPATFTGVNGIVMAGTASTAGILVSGACAIPLSITGAFTTGISIAADGTTAISVTSAFSGVTGFSFAGTASGDGILISGACADGIHISGTNTASGLHISGDQVDAILIDGDAAADNGIKILVDDGVTLGCGINIDRTGTTGVCTTGISIDTDGTTGIEIAAGFSGVNMISLAGTGSTSGIIISGACAIPLNITGAFTTGITIAADGTTGISITSAFSGVNAISLAGTGSTAGINISGNHTTAITIGAQTTAGIAITGATATGISITGACSTVAFIVGAKANTAGSGQAIPSTDDWGSVRVFTDDAGANIADSVRGVQSRTLLTVAQSAGTIRALQGQLKAIDAVNFATGVYTAVQGYIELVGSQTVASTAALSCFDASIEIGTALTATGYVAGFKAELTGAGTCAAGLDCGFLVTNAAGAAVWTYGLYVEASAVDTGIYIGACTTGISIAGATTTGISITGSASTAALQIGVSGTPAGDFLWYGTTALYKVLFDANGDTNGAVYIGADTKGVMFNLYGITTGCGVFWDPDGDTNNGTLSIGATGGSKGVDVTMFGATSGCYAKWDQSADSLEVVKTSAVATATNLYSVNIGQTLTGASTVNTAEVLRSVLTSNVQVGNWANAILGKIDFSTAGFVTGLAGVVCAELDMPAATIGNGSYCCFEAELNAPTNAAGWGASVPVAFLTGNAWGSGVAEYRDDGYIFNFTGLGSATGGKIFDTCTAAAASHALRILIDGVPYYIMLNSNVDA